jgi:hypothetical protein
MWSRTHLECSVSPLSGSMTSLRILSRKSANLSGLQRWTSSPITCKQSCGLRASGRGRAIMLMPIRIRIVLHMMESRILLFTFIHGSASLFCFIFLIIVIGVLIINILDSTYGLWEFSEKSKVKLYTCLNTDPGQEPDPPK